MDFLRNLVQGALSAPSPARGDGLRLLQPRLASRFEPVASAAAVAEPPAPAPSPLVAPGAAAISVPAGPGAVSRAALSAAPVPDDGPRAARAETAGQSDPAASEAGALDFRVRRALRGVPASTIQPEAFSPRPAPEAPANDWANQPGAPAADARLSARADPSPAEATSSELMSSEAGRAPAPAEGRAATRGTLRAAVRAAPPDGRRNEPRPAPANGADAEPPEPVIQVTIGRIEVRAAPAGPAPARPAPTAPRMTLEDYIRKRNARGGDR
jgi:hypothetical protein